MMDYDSEPCQSCGEHKVIYHQYIGDACCEGCGEWQDEIEFSKDIPVSFVDAVYWGEDFNRAEEDQ